MERATHVGPRIQQHISSSEMELGLKFWPVTQRNPTQTLFDPLTRPGHRVSVLWIERLFWRRCATSECFLPKVSGLCSTHTQIIKIYSVLKN